MPDKKITQLTELITALSDDPLAIVDLVAGETKKITKDNLLKGKIDITFLTTKGDLLTRTAAALARLGVGADDQVLTADSAQAAGIKWAAPVAGQTLYEAIVAPAGGDYTTLGAAITAGKKRIFIRNGTYAEAGNINLPDGVVIVGESREGVIINIGAFVLQCLGTGGNERKIELYNFTLNKDTNVGDLTDFNFIDGSVIQNVHFDGHTSASLYCLDIASSERVVVRGCYFEKHGYGIFWAGIECWYNLITGNYFANNRIGVRLEGADFTLVANNVFKGGYFAIDLNACDHIQIIGNYLYDQVGGAGGPGAINTENSTRYCLIAGNYIYSPAEKAITIRASLDKANAIIGNHIWDPGHDAIEIATGSDENSVLSNYFYNVNTSYEAVDDNGDWTTIRGNVSIGPGGTDGVYVEEKNIVMYKNVSGGAIAAGNVVIRATSAALNEITTTAVQGDDKVLGVAETAAGNNFPIAVKVLGKTTLLKVNGTAAIAIGDFLGTYTVAGIAMKAAAGDMAIAIALEAYAVADSNGVIDALIIEPRKI